MNLKHLIRTLMVITLISLVVKCALPPPPGKAPTNRVTPLPTQTPTFFPEDTLTRSATQMASTPTIILPNSLQLREQCIPTHIAQELDGIEETIVTFGMDNSLSLWQPNDKLETQLGRMQILNGAYSNHHKLAYIDDDLHQLRIVSPTGDVLATFLASDQWVEVLGWAGDNKVLISNMPFWPDGGWKPPSSTIVLELSTGKTQEHLPDYPNIYQYGAGSPRFGRYSYSITAYDSTFSRVIYPAATNKETTIILWDLPNRERLTSLQVPLGWSEPVWRDDGTSFITSVPAKYSDWQGNVYKNVEDNLPFLGGNDLFEVSRDGKITRLTFFTTEFTSEQRSYAWSPDHQIIAFWLKKEDDPRWTLSLLKISTGEVIDLCVDGGTDASYEIFWLPDGNRILTTLWFEEGDKRALLVDFKEKIAVMVPKKETIIGWMENNH